MYILYSYPKQQKRMARPMTTGVFPLLSRVSPGRHLTRKKVKMCHLSSYSSTVIESVLPQSHPFQLDPPNFLWLHLMFLCIRIFLFPFLWQFLCIRFFLFLFLCLFLSVPLSSSVSICNVDSARHEMMKVGNNMRPISIYISSKLSCIHFSTYLK